MVKLGSYLVTVHIAGIQRTETTINIFIQEWTKGLVSLHFQRKVA